MALRLILATTTLLLASSATGAQPIVERLGRSEQLLRGPSVPPYFETGEWHWNEQASLPPPLGCEPSAPNETLLARPRVDLFRCQKGFPRTLVGTTATGPNWTRPLRHQSGTHTVDLYVGSVNPGAITLDTLEVIDPGSGRTLQSAPMRMIDAPLRAMPIVRITGPVTCPPEGGDCFGAVGEGQNAGLLRITRDGRALVLEKPQRKRFAPIAITDIQLVGDRLLLAEEWQFRGTKWVRVAVVDPSSGKRLFEERHGEDRVVSDPRIVLGTDGEIAFHYRDATAGRAVMIRYRIVR